jgi:LysR family nitrogen assimilation transcriptional regulator
MDLRQLRYFAKIVELKNMTAASNVLCVAQPSLSHHLANLEVHFGAKLLVREARGVRCTPAGQVLYEHAKVILRQIELAEAAVKNYGLSLPENVTLGMPRSEAPLLAPHLLQTLALAHPQLSLTIIEDSPDALMELIADQKIDVALLADVSENAAFDALHLVTEDMLLVGPQTNEERLPLPLAKLADIPFILPRPPSSIRTKVDNLCKGLSIPCRVVAESASIGVALSCVKAGICWTILPWAALVRVEDDSGLSVWEIDGAPLKRELFACMSKNAVTRPSANIARALLIDTVRQLVQSREWKHVKLSADVALD